MSPQFFTAGQMRSIGFALIVSMLSGCAAQKTFDEGTMLVQQDNPEQGLKKMQAASKMDPGQIEFRTKYYETRDASINGYLVKADSEIALRHFQQASDLYNRVLGIDPNNVRARDGLVNVGVEKRHDQLLQQAGQSLQNGDLADARQKLQAILTEDPSNSQALDMESRLDAKTVKPVAHNSLQDVYKKPITLQFKDATLKQICEIISQTSGLNFVFDKDVKTDQKTSIFLKDSNIESAIYYTLMTNQLDSQVLDGNTILIYPNSAAKQKDYQEMVVKSFFLTNADAKTVAATLKSILKTRDLVIDEKLNMIIMRDSPEAVRLAEKLVALHDVAEPEVMLEVAVMEVKRTKLQDLGVQWPNGLTLTPLTPLAAAANATGATVSGTGATVTATGAGGQLVLSDLKSIPAASVGIGNPSATINAHSTDGDANLLANPRIRTRNHEKATIMIGDRVPNITVNTAPNATSYISETITYVDVGLKLSVEPTVFLDNDVGIKISLEVSNIVSQLVTKSGSEAYQIGTRNAATVLRLKDGETQVLAGLLDDEERHTINKIPALGDIPILGRLFGSTNDDIQKTEIVLSITPHLIRNIQRPVAGLAEFSSGTENNLKPRPDTIARSVTVVDAGPVVIARSNPLQKKAGKNAPEAAGVTDPGTQNSVPASTTPAPAGEVDVAPIPASGADGTEDTTPTQTNALKLSMRTKGVAAPRVGSSFNVLINGKSDERVGALPMLIGFDNKYFEVVSVTEGDFFKQVGVQTSFNSDIDPKGQISINASASGGDGAQTGSVAVVTFKALSGPADSTISVLSASPVNSDGHTINLNKPANLLVHVAE